MITEIRVYFKCKSLDKSTGEGRDVEDLLFL